MRSEYLYAIGLGILSLWSCGGEITTRGQWLSGQVLASNGQPIPGVVLSGPAGARLTDESGRFAMLGTTPTLHLRKPGFQSRLITRQPSERLRITLTMSPQANPRIGVDTRGGGRETSRLQAALRERGAILTAYPATPLSGCEVLILATPGPMTDSEKTKVLNWVKQGGRLILLGEWGGYPYQDLSSLNALAQPAGILFSGSTYKTTDERLLARISLPSLQVPGTDTVPLYAATTLNIQEPARPWLEPVTNGYQILGNRSVILGAVGPLGQGKVFGIGDTSAWRDHLTDHRLLSDTDSLVIEDLTWSLVNW